MKTDVKILLYNIFEYSLKPSFYVEHNAIITNFHAVYNNQSEYIGIYYSEYVGVIVGTTPLKRHCFELDRGKSDYLLSKIRHFSNVDSFSYQNTLFVCSCLYEWLRGNFPHKLDGVEIWCEDINKKVKFNA